MDARLADVNYVPPLTWDNVLNLSASGQIFYLAALAAFAPLLVLPFVRPADVDRAKEKAANSGDGSVGEPKPPADSPQDNQ